MISRLADNAASETGEPGPGGDYVDIIELDGRSVAAIIGDVAGKDMPAALLMALLQGSLRRIRDPPFWVGRTAALRTLLAVPL